MLLVDGDDGVRQDVSRVLIDAGILVDLAATRAELESATTRPVDLLIYDIRTVDDDALERCQLLRATVPDCPMIVLAPDADEGFRLGADDYVLKPLRPAEVLARARRWLADAAQPTRAGSDTPPGRLSVGADLWIDGGARRAGRGEVLLNLKPREFDLLAFLMANPNKAWSREQLLDRVWGTDRSDTRTVDLHVRRLRVQIEDSPENPVYLETVWGVGYRFNSSAETASAVGESPPQ